MPETSMSFQMKTASMAGKSWHPSHEPHVVRGTGNRHTVETMERGRERGWEENYLGDDFIKILYCHYCL